MHERPASAPGDRSAVERVDLFVAPDVNADGPIDLGGDLEAGAAPGHFVAEFSEAIAGELCGALDDAERRFLLALERAVSTDGFRLPPMPKAAIRVQRLIDSPDCDVDTLATELERDPILTTKIVGIANSPFYAGMLPLSAAKQAVLRIGLQETRNIVTAIALRSKVFRVPGFEQMTECLWHHSLAASVTSQAVAERTGVDPDAGFLAGLIHDIGRLAILSVSGEVRRAGGAGAETRVESLQRISDRTHAGLSAIVAGSWQIHELLVSAIGHHHQPERAPESARPLARALAAGDYLSWSVMGQEAPGVFDAEALWRELDLDAAARAEVVEQATEPFRSIAKEL